ncbi:MAG: serine/threonine-protein kinase [Bacteroidota bacterium]
MKMDAEQWDRLNALFDAACEHPADEREAYVRQASAGDRELFDAVMGLLREDKSTAQLLDGVVFDTQALLATAPQEGDRVGPYRLVRHLGTGGMGAVYLAERADGHFEQQVAIKVIRQGFGSDQTRQRFHHERQILARLQHPHIARLLDGGVTERGQSYLVLEYVEGEPIDAYCDARQLTIDDRLALFGDVCKAVLYAHSQLVIHRDLKPSNILVTPEGHVKLLDFGVAKLLSDDADGLVDGLVLTQGAAPMTPAYASPEQVRGEPVGTSTDIYSLGVVLYELLAGHRPYLLNERSAADVARVICDEQPVRPSTAIRTRAADATATASVSEARRTAPERLQRRLHGDLDMISLMALRKEPSRRYPSVEALADDVRRHLAGLPVRAQRDTLRYRAGKFIRRHRLGVAVSVLIPLLMGFYTVQLVQERNRAEAEQARAALEAEKAQTVAAFLESLFNASDPFSDSQDAAAPGPDVTALELLERGASQVETDLADQAEVQIRMMLVLGNAFQGLGAYEAAEAQLKQALERSRANAEQDPMQAVESATELASLYWELGRYDASEALHRESVAQLRSLVAADDLRLQVALNNLATLFLSQGRYAEAEPVFGEALAVARTHYDGDHADLATYIANYGLVQRYLGRLPEAEALLREALAMSRRLQGDQHAGIGNMAGNLGTILLRQDKVAEAERYYREALAVRQATLGPEHPYVAISLNELAGARYAQGDLAAADSLFTQALALRRRVLPESHPHLAYSLVGLGRVQLDTGRAASAEALFREALDIRLRVVAEDHELAAETQSLLGASLSAQQRYAEARSLLVASAEVLEARLGPDEARTQAALARLAALEATE